MKNLKINHAAVWIGAVIGQFMYPIWYSEVFLGKSWMELNKFTLADFENVSMVPGLILSIVNLVVFGYVIAWIFTKLNVQTALEGLKYASIFWFGILFLEVATQNQFTLRPFELTLIDQGIVLLRYEVFGILLGAWTKFK